MPLTQTLPFPFSKKFLYSYLILSLIKVLSQLYSTEIKRNTWFIKNFYNSFHMKTIINLISFFFFFCNLTFIFSDNSDS